MQNKLDAKIEAVAGAGPFGKESTAADLNRQPTPGSIAAADQAVAALARARAADRAGDKGACEQGLTEVERELSR